MRFVTLVAMLAPLIVAADTGFLFTAGGRLSRVDRQALTPLFDCTRTSRIARLPEETAPCRLDDLVVHPATGRYAMTLDAPTSLAERDDGGHEPISVTTAIELAGRQVQLPRPRAGVPPSGQFLVIGHPRVGAAPLVLEGLRDTWTHDGRFLVQTPLAFTADGEGLLVAEKLGSVRWRLWTLDLRGPPRWRLELGGQVYQRITLAAGARAVELHAAPGTVAFLDVPASPASALARPSPRRGLGSLAVARVADSIVSFQEGDCRAERESPGYVGRYLRTSSTGAVRVWRQHPQSCSTRDTLLAVNEARRSVFFSETGGYRGQRLFEYALDGDAVREHQVDPRTVLTVSRDGRVIGVVEGGGLELRGLDDGLTWWRTELPEKTSADEVKLAFAELTP